MGERAKNASSFMKAGENTGPTGHPGRKSTWSCNGRPKSLCKEVDETGAYYTEQSKPERKTPIQYTNTYIWNLGRWQ